VARYKNEIHALLTVLFPEFSQVFAVPTRPTALALLKRYPSAQAMAAAGIETITTILHEVAPRNLGHQTAEQLVNLAQHSVSSGVATFARVSSFKILCDKLEHTQSNLTHLEEEIDKLLEADPGSKGLRSVPEFGRKMVAVLRRNWEMSLVYNVPIKSWPTQDWKLKSKRAANGKDKPSSPNAAVGGFVDSCT
jgi:transposase